MAEILIKAVNANHIDPIEDQRGCYKRGNPVVVFPDGHKWGKEEGLPKFFILKITDVSVNVAQEYIQPEYSRILTADGTQVVLTRRLYKFLIDNVPSPIKNQILTTGRATASFAEIRSYIQNKTTGMTEK